MTNFTPYILRFSFLFLFFSLTTYSFGQNGRGDSGLPDVRTENDGGGTHNDCITLNGEDHTITFTVTISSPNLISICPLAFGYTIPGSNIEYLNPNTVQVHPNGDIVYTFTLTITPDDAAALCGAREKETDMTGFEYNIYCNANGTYELFNSALPNEMFAINICCSSQDLTSPSNDDNLNNRLNSGTITNIFTLKNDLIEEDKIIPQQEITYYLYDMYGNHVETIQNSSSQTSIENVIAMLSIRSGVYFVRYLDGTEIRTKKVYKQ